MNILYSKVDLQKRWCDQNMIFIENARLIHAIASYTMYLSSKLIETNCLENTIKMHNELINVLMVS